MPQDLPPILLNDRELQLIIEVISLREMYFQRQGSGFDYAAKELADLRSKIFDQIDPEGAAK